MFFEINQFDFSYNLSLRHPDKIKRSKYRQPAAECWLKHDYLDIMPSNQAYSGPRY